MAVLTVQDLPVSGGAPTMTAAAAGGDEAPVGPGVFAYVVNGSAAQITVTFSVPVAVGGAVTLAKTVAAGAAVWVPLPARNAAPHGSAAVKRISGDRATWTYSAAASVTVAVLRAP
jgi:hypothetical protein